MRMGRYKHSRSPKPRRTTTGATGSSRSFSQEKRHAWPKPATRCPAALWWAGRLLAFGNDSAATDAQHVSVEFVHPVIVGKRALPALDLGPNFETGLPVVLQPEDMVMGFAFPEGEAAVERTLSAARERGRADVCADGGSGGILVRVAGL